MKMPPDLEWKGDQVPVSSALMILTIHWKTVLVKHNMCLKANMLPDLLMGFLLVSLALAQD